MGKRSAAILAITLIVFAGCTVGNGNLHSSYDTQETQLYSEWFPDAPPPVNAPNSVPPSLPDYRDEIVAACVQAGLDQPVLITDLSEQEMKATGAHLYQRTAYLDMNPSTQCRCTYFILASQDTVYSAWIEASLVINDLHIPDSLHIFPADTRNQQILDTMKSLYL